MRSEDQSAVGLSLVMHESNVYICKSSLEDFENREATAGKRNDA